MSGKFSGKSTPNLLIASSSTLDKLSSKKPPVKADKKQVPSKKVLIIKRPKKNEITRNEFLENDRLEVMNKFFKNDFVRLYFYTKLFCNDPKLKV